MCATINKYLAMIVQMTHPHVKQIRYNRLKLQVSRILFLIGAFLLLFDLYFIWNIHFYELDILLGNFIFGCALVLLSFTSKFTRMVRARFYKTNGWVRKGECTECGTCCRLPIPCLFFYGNRCLIHNMRPKQCREFPSGPEDLVSYDCGYYFEKKVA